MMTNWKLGKIEPFWDEQYKDLNYIKEPFNNQEEVDVWKKDGYVHPVAFDFRSAQRCS